MATKETTTETTTERLRFAKAQLVAAKRYKHKQDVVNVVLKQDQLYTFDEVDELIENFLKEKVN